MKDDKIGMLYRQIPSFKCKPGCTDCCGPVPFSKTEWDKINDKRKATSLTCPYAVSGHCEIYEDRPFICRLFGASIDPAISCPHGCGPIIPLTKTKAASLRDQYIRLMEEKPQ